MKKAKYNNSPAYSQAPVSCLQVGLLPGFFLKLVIQFSLRQSLGAVLGTDHPKTCLMVMWTGLPQDCLPLWSLSSLPVLPHHVSEHHVHLPNFATHPGYATHFHGVVLLKSAWEAVAQPSCDCRHFKLDKPTNNYFLKTPDRAHCSLVPLWGWSEGTSPEEWECKPPTPLGTRGLLGALSNARHSSNYCFPDL